VRLERARRHGATGSRLNVKQPNRLRVSASSAAGAVGFTSGEAAANKPAVACSATAVHRVLEQNISDLAILRPLFAMKIILLSKV
jgi:hypothetical protein